MQHVVSALGVDVGELFVDLVEEPLVAIVELEGHPHPALFAGLEVLDEDPGEVVAAGVIHARRMAARTAPKRLADRSVDYD